MLETIHGSNMRRPFNGQRNRMSNLVRSVPAQLDQSGRIARPHSVHVHGLSASAPSDTNVIKVTSFWRSSSEPSGAKVRNANCGAALLGFEVQQAMIEGRACVGGLEFRLTWTVTTQRGGDALAGKWRHAWPRTAASAEGRMA